MSVWRNCFVLSLGVGLQVHLGILQLDSGLFAGWAGGEDPNGRLMWKDKWFPPI